MTLPEIKITNGTIVADPELRFTPNGHAVINFRVACNSRRKNPQTNEWEDGDTTFVTVNAWKDLAENIGNEGFTKGSKVNVDGRLKQRDYETREGEKRTVFEVEADSVAKPIPKFKRNDQGAPQGNPQQGGFGQQQNFSQPQQGGWNNPMSEQAPF